MTLIAVKAGKTSIGGNVEKSKKEDINVTVAVISEEEIRNKIYTIRGVQVMLDTDLAAIYGYPVKVFNQQIKRNKDRFPEDFMFQMTKEEYIQSRSQFVTSIMQDEGTKGGRVYYPYVFTEQGIYMLMTVLKGELAVRQSIMLIRLFRQMKDYIIQTDGIYRHLERIDDKLIEHDRKFEKILEDLTDPSIKKSALFFSGEMYDAFSLLTKIVREAKSSIVLIDNYVDTTTLDILSKKNSGVSVIIVTANPNRLTQKDISSFKAEYGNLEIRESHEFHDRFLILDRMKLYYVGASLKDAGKKCFELSLIDDSGQITELLRRI